MEFVTVIGILDGMLDVVDGMLVDGMLDVVDGMLVDDTLDV